MDVGAALVADGQPAEAISQAKVRSTTQRWRPSRSLDSMPLRAMRTWMWRWGGRGGTRDVVGLVGVELVRALAPPPVGLLDRRDRIEQRPRRR